MPRYGSRSQGHKRTLHPDLQLITDDLIEIYDNSIVWGYRGEIDQNIAWETKNSKLRFPHSAHNRMPSRAMDTIPYPEKWEASREEFMYMQGLIRGIAHKRGIRLKPIIPWDLAHTELED